MAVAVACGTDEDEDEALRELGMTQYFPGPGLPMNRGGGLSRKKVGRFASETIAPEGGHVLRRCRKKRGALLGFFFRTGSSVATACKDASKRDHRENLEVSHSIVMTREGINVNGIRYGIEKAFAKGKGAQVSPEQVTTIAVSSQKGGVGKTTLSINLAHSFARNGRRTLLVDADPQGSVGLSLTRQSRILPGFYDLMADPLYPLDRLIVPTRLETLSLVAAGQTSDYELGGGGMGVTLHRVREFLKAVEGRGFDICIIDTAAGLFGATADVLSASSAVIVPQQAEPLGIRSVPKLMTVLARMKVVNPNLNILGLLLTMMQPGLAESREAAQALKDILPSEMFFQTMIPRDDIFIRASARGLPVGAMENGAGAMAVFDQVRMEVEAKLAASMGGR